ncbi:hypothetical protein [Pseudomonas sp. GL-RE-19]|uniref:hypothetical protein n=1 Tax=Pseudomonas sp. GL-RE-19 TaxID=2832389 RepID=UPI001CBE8885|nr:hypothetical protein [Pseudomonas sp. GL-RE-19]
MNKPKLSQEEQEYLQMIEKKKRNRDKLLAAIAAASPENLERVAVSIKAALCKSGPPARPRSFASLQEKV